MNGTNYSLSLLMREITIALIAASLVGIINYITNERLIKAQIQSAREQYEVSAKDMRDSYKNEAQKARDDARRELDSQLKLLRKEHEQAIDLLSRQFELQKKDSLEKIRAEFETNRALLELQKRDAILNEKIKYFDYFDGAIFAAYTIHIQAMGFIRFELYRVALAEFLQENYGVRLDDLHAQFQNPFRQVVPSDLVESVVNLQSLARKSQYLFPKDVSDKIILFARSSELKNLYLFGAGENMNGYKEQARSSISTAFKDFMKRHPGAAPIGNEYEVIGEMASALINSLKEFFAQDESGAGTAYFTQVNLVMAAILDNIQNQK